MRNREPTSETRFFLHRTGPMFRRLSYVIGAVVVAAGVSMFPAIITSLVYREWETAGWIVVSAVITILFGVIGWRVVGRSGTLTTKEGFATVGLAWFAMALFGVLPYLLTGSIDNFTNAFFETASGFTTTGASLVPDPARLPHGILVWRSMTQWLGGMGGDCPVAGGPSAAGCRGSTAGPGRISGTGAGPSHSPLPGDRQAPLVRLRAGHRGGNASPLGGGHDLVPGHQPRIHDHV